MSDSGFVTLTLADIAEFCNGKGISPSLYSPYGKYPVFGSNGQIARTDELLNPSPVIVIGRVGAFCGSVYRVDEPSWTTDNAIVVKPQPHIDFGFLYYRLKSLDINRTAIGSAQPLVTQGGLKIIQTLVPSLSEQKAIAHILGTLDNKIELNQQMNRNLEAIASAIFKSWFIDFDPIRAKMEGREPTGMDAATAALFSDSFEDSPLGEIPRGWKAASLGDIIALYDSRRIPLSNRERAQRQGQYPYYGAASVMDYVDDYLFDGVYVLMGEDGSVIDDKDHPVIQYVWGKFWVNNHAHVLQGANGISNEHLMLFLKQINIHPYVIGAVQPKLNQGNLRCIPFVLPSPKVCDVFRVNVSRLYALFRANYDQSYSLATIRDTLLPKLISGEIRVKEVEKIVEAVA